MPICTDDRDIMAAAYSYDLRIRVMETYDKGMKVTKLCQLFNISRYTFYEWKRLREKTEDINAATGYQQGHSHKIKDWEAFERFVEEQGHLTLKEMATEWPEFICYTTIARGMKKLGCTHKKRPMVTESVMKQRAKIIKKK
jgi:transposase